MADNLLDLTTDEPLPTVTIDKKKYAIAMDMDYGDILALSKMGNRVQALMDKEALTEQEEAELGERLDKVVRNALRAPGEVLDKLRDLQRFAIVSAFTKLVNAGRDPTATAPEISSGVSNGSTAEA